MSLEVFLSLQGGSGRIQAMSFNLYGCLWEFPWPFKSGWLSHLSVPSMPSFITGKWTCEGVDCEGPC
jgi:hypothetical protein